MRENRKRNCPAREFRSFGVNAQKREAAVYKRINFPDFNGERNLMGEINYLEHTFDYEHIFTLEYMDDEFRQLSHFSVDG